MFAHNLSNELIVTANKLLDQENPTDGDVRRSVSTAYYAVFHKLCHSIACCLIGDNPETHPRRAWTETYRTLMHGQAADKCQKIIPKNGEADNMGFPDCLVNFSTSFKNLKSARDNADYDPEWESDKSTANTFVIEAETAIECLEQTSDRDMRAFSAWLLFNSPGTNAARTLKRERQ